MVGSCPVHWLFSNIPTTFPNLWLSKISPDIIRGEVGRGLQNHAWREPLPSSRYLLLGLSFRHGGLITVVILEIMEKGLGFFWFICLRPALLVQDSNLFSVYKASLARRNSYRALVSEWLYYPCDKFVLWWLFSHDFRCSVSPRDLQYDEGLGPLSFLLLWCFSQMSCWSPTWLLKERNQQAETGGACISNT